MINHLAGFMILNSSLVKYYVGDTDAKHYTRRLVGSPEGIVVRCKKPKYSKKQRKAMAERPQVKRFVAVNQEAQAILHDPVLRAEWELKHAAARKEGTRRNYYVSPRLWDYIRHELNIAKTEAEKAIQK